MQEARLAVLMEVTRLGEVPGEEATEEVVVEKVKDEEVKVVEDRRRLLVAPRVKRRVVDE